MWLLRNESVLLIFFIFLETQKMTCLGLGDKGLTLEDAGKERTGIWALRWQFGGEPRSTWNAETVREKEINFHLIEPWSVRISLLEGFIYLFNEAALGINKDILIEV